MHEKSVMDPLIHKIIDLAKQEQAAKVTAVFVWVGALSHMSRHHFKEHFDVASFGTIAQDAEIHVEESLDIHDPNATAIILRKIDVAN